MELARGPDGRVAVSFERVGGIVRIRGNAVLRHPAESVLQPMTVVMREEDAEALWIELWRETGCF